MKRIIILLLCLGLGGCATMPSIWPIQDNMEMLYYVPQKMASVDEAIGAIKNLQPNFVDWVAGGSVSSIDVDAYGMRANWSLTVTSQQTAYVPTYGGMFVGSNYVPVYGGSQQTQTSSQTSSGTIVIPFDNVEDINLWHMPSIPNDFKWGLIVLLKNNAPQVSLRVSDEASVVKLANAIRTIAMARGVEFSEFSLGLAVRPLTPQQSEDMGLTPNTGLLVVGVAKNSSAEKSGIQFLDVLLEFNKTPLKTNKDLIHATQSVYKTGKKVASVKIIRRENEQKVEKNIDVNLVN